MHDVGVPSDARALVRLQLADEMPGDGEAGAARSLRRRLLVPVLAEVGDTKLAQQPDVRRGPGLGDRHQRDLPGAAARRSAGCGNALPDRAQAPGKLGTAGAARYLILGAAGGTGIGHLRKSGTSRSSSSSKTTGRRRVAVTSKTRPAALSCCAPPGCRLPCRPGTPAPGWPLPPGWLSPACAAACREPPVGKP